MPEPRSLPGLLMVAARLLEQAAPLPPACVRCALVARGVPPITVTPASPSMSPVKQLRLVRGVSGGMNWFVQGLQDRDGLVAVGRADGVKVEAIAAPIAGHARALKRRQVTTVEHAALLRTMIDWSANLPPQVTALEVREDLHGPCEFGVHLVLADHEDTELVRYLACPANTGATGFHDGGTLPTGHTATFSVGS